MIVFREHGVKGGFFELELFNLTVVDYPNNYRHPLRFNIIKVKLDCYSW